MTSGNSDTEYESEEEEFEAMRDYIAMLMANTDPSNMLDSLLIMANVCEQRALLATYNPPLALWYRTTAQALRACLTIVSRGVDAPHANPKLENPLLYFPEPKDYH